MKKEFLLQDIVLNTVQSNSLIDNLLHPQEEVLNRRDAFLTDLLKSKWIQYTESSFSVELPNLDLSFLDVIKVVNSQVIQSIEFNLKEADIYGNSLERAKNSRKYLKQSCSFTPESESYNINNLKTAEYSTSFSSACVA